MIARLLRIDPAVLFLIFLTAFGFALRMYDLGSQSLWYDEGYSIQAALAMLDKGAPVLPSGWFYTHGLLSTGFMAASMGMFGETELAARLPSVIFGTLTIPLVFFFARRIGGTRTALIAAFIVTFLAIEIAWSRQARMYQQLQFFYMLSLYLFYLFTQKRSNKLLILTFIATVCTALSHTFGFSIFLVLPAWLALANIRSIR
ncbi:MAG: glycosyltransferase family 39 protein, partial [Dehalococcoidia bacterium]